MADVAEDERISVETIGTETTLTIKVTFAAFSTKRHNCLECLLYCCLLGIIVL